MSSANFMSRRDTLIAAAALSSMPVASAFAAQRPSVDYDSVRQDIAKIIANDPDKGPTFVRLAWHSSGTYEKMGKSGGSGRGTIRFREELAHGANAGLDKAISWLEPVHSSHPGLSYADLFTLSGVVAIAEAGGPPVGWRAGRVDAIDESAATPDGRLPGADKGPPNANAAHLRDIFGRMGFSDREIVALAGAHALGRCHVDASGYTGPWTPTPLKFTNQYFTLLMNVPWTLKKWDGPMQFEDPTGQLMMLPSDIVLIQDGDFRKVVKSYAKNSDLFFSDFAAAFQKLEELGCSNLKNV